MAMLGAGAWLEKNVCADDSGTSMVPHVGRQINQPRESRRVGINKAPNLIYPAPNNSLRS